MPQTSPQQASDGSAPAGFPEMFDVVWTSPSCSSAESMPSGAGGVGLAVWCEDGDLLAYVDRSGSFDENNQMLKLGRLRLRLSPNPFDGPETFCQRLALGDGDVLLDATRDGLSCGARFWVERHRPVVHVDVQATAPVTVEIAYEGWRLAERPLDATERNACLSFQHTDPARVHVVTRPDVVEQRPRAVRFWHCNDPADLLFDKAVTIQRLGAVRDQLWNPQRDFVFGGELSGPGLRAAAVTDGHYPPNGGVDQGCDHRSWWLASSEPAVTHRADLVLYHGTHPDLADWHTGLERTDPTWGLDAERVATIDWWQAFWLRSWIVIDADDPTSTGWRVGRNYQLFRHLLGVAAGGDFPLKFNGGLFTVDAELTPQNDSLRRTPDFRAWGGGSITAQNQRLLHYPMLRSGDGDLIDPQLEFYARSLGNAELRTRTYWGHDGASFAEQLENFGLPCLSIYDFDWDRYGVAPRPLGPGRLADPGFLANDWCTDLYDTALEMALLALEQYAYRRDGEEARATLRRWLPFVTSTVRFFDAHFRGEDGRLVLAPTCAAETYKGAVDAVTTVAGLRVVTERLLGLPAHLTAPDQRDEWRRLHDDLPPLPTRWLAGHEVLAPAASWTHINNVEFPQLYPVFPWGLIGLGRPGIELAVDTYRHGADLETQRGTHGWRQDAIFAARLGLTEEARSMITAKLADAPRRYPTFWGPNFDWTPDLNHGGSAAIALQEMLLQSTGRTLHVLPAWPRDWDVDFRLHAAGGATVSGTVSRGALEVSVTPGDVDLVVVRPDEVSA